MAGRAHSRNRVILNRGNGGAPSAAAQLTMTLRDSLRGHVEALASIGPRTLYAPPALERAVQYVETSFGAAGYAPGRQVFRVDDVPCANVEVEVRGRSDRGEILVVGAHYDSVEISPGADDNASGVAGLLELARRFRARAPRRTIRFVAFVNEEPPHFRTRSMGSWRYAQRSRQRREKIVAMLSLESIGYYDDTPGSQHYPPPLALFYPSRANFIGFAGNLASARLVRTCVSAFRRRARTPAEGAAVPELIEPVGWSDQWAFWQTGVPALMVTDTAPFRNPHYHTPDDLPETLDYATMTDVVEGLTGVVEELAG